MFEKMIHIFARYDLGFIGARLALVAPIFIFAHLYSNPEFFGTFSKYFHTALFLGNIALYGAHEKLLVEKGSIAQSEFYHILLRTFIIGLIAYGLALAGYLHFSLIVWVFLFCYRTIPFYLFALTKSQPLFYALLAATMGVTVFCLLLAGENLLLSIVPLAFISCFILYRQNIFKRDRLRHAASNIAGDYKDGFHYFLNILTASVYIQGTLFLFTFLSTAKQYAIATHYVYILHLSLILQSLMYRVLISLTAEKLNREDRLRFLFHSLGMMFALACLSALCIGFFYAELEILLLGVSYISDRQLLLLLVTLFVHSVNMILAGFLVGSGNVRIQSHLNLFNGVVLVCLMGGLYAIGHDYILEYSLLFGATMALCLRAAAIWFTFKEIKQ